MAGVLLIIMPTKVGIKSSGTCFITFVHARIYITNQLELCLHELTQIVANAAWRVGSW